MNLDRHEQVLIKYLRLISHIMHLLSKVSDFSLKVNFISLNRFSLKFNDKRLEGNVIIITFWEVTQVIHQPIFPIPFHFSISSTTAIKYMYVICIFLIFDYDTVSTQLIEMALNGYSAVKQNTIWKDIPSFSFVNISS